jgi:hypothetical protein
MTESPTLDVREAVYAIIDADLSLQETREAVISLIPEEYRGRL